MTKSAHLIGIGGTGLSAIARVLLESGWRVSGSDRQASPLAQALEQAGARVFIGHAASNLGAVDLVIRSSAISDDNPEVQAALAAGIPVLKRADFLGNLMAERSGIAVAGSHGKTTTTAMIAWILTALGQDPSFIIGGVAHDLGTNARAGKGSSFVIEADEYDRMFLGLRPRIAVVLNVEHDHPDCYPTAQDFYQAFLAFTRCIQPGGTLIACADDPGAASLAGEVANSQKADLKVLRYGLDAPMCDYRARGLAAQPQGTRFEAVYQDQALAQVALQVPGRHNVSNALAALAVVHQSGLDASAAAEALGRFHGSGRRFDLRGEAAGVTVIDDYGHHPTEIRSTLKAARQRYPGQAVWAVWQPHTYSRVKMLFNEFSQAFEQADHVVVTEVYASREIAAIGSFSAQEILPVMRHPDAHFAATLEQAVELLLERLHSGDVLVVFSAGDADQISAQVLAQLAGHNEMKIG